MDIGDVKEVDIADLDNHKLTFKFIVVRLHDQNDVRRNIIRAKSSKEMGVSHSTILEGVWSEPGIKDGIDAECIGGGTLYVDHDEKRIIICGQSRDFGEEPNRIETVSMLQGAFPDFQVSELFDEDE